MTALKRPGRIALCIAAASLVTSAAGLAAFAGPQLVSPGQPVMGGTSHEVTCWQEGREIYAETSEAVLAAIDLGAGNSVGLSGTDGSRRTFVALGEAVCLIAWAGD